MNLKKKEEMNYLLLLNALIDDENFGLTIKLETFTKNIKKVIVVIDSFILLLPIWWKESS